ncbi:recombinase family protein [Deinococcus sp. 23YEL01]|uniref:recombinase family protein n=1 Tax=Deinococcus sp. 23YEL01 TaxID=2745871 RepID=UPI001E461F3E|nr:recombinase family protein [Deinococcus sp. 23YEL01]MCD0170911.1 recombinase family protein [Deinococcus sp. 23YEL01]
MTTPTSTAVAYYRVSTAKQGASGLGLEAQRAAVLAFAQARGLTLTAEFTEVETGTKKRHRPELASALEQARRSGGVLLIAKLDRLARNVAFISALMESGVRFVAVDMPEVDNLTIHVMAAVAEREAQLISARTKAALGAVKARGVTLGKPENLTHTAQVKGAVTQRDAARAAERPLVGYVKLLKESGRSLRGIAALLNEEGHTTRTGKKFTAVQVGTILKRAGT